MDVTALVIFRLMMHVQKDIVLKEHTLMVQVAMTVTTA